MTIKRRIFVSGLAALLSVIRLPGVLASEESNMPEIDFEDYDYGPFVE
jgi:hypothetical protein